MKKQDINTMRFSRICLLTLGCSKNIADSRQISGMLLKAGYSLVEDPGSAEILIINTCGFVDAAKTESIEAILEFAKYKKQRSCKILVALGCLVQKYGAELAEALPEVDFFLGIGDIKRLPELLAGISDENNKLIIGRPEDYLFEDRWAGITGSKHVEYLKIADGCNHNCTYCVIPEIKGRYRSRTIGSIVSEANQLVLSGCREIILVAQDTSLYGYDIDPERGLCDLIDALEEIPLLQWIRLMYYYPIKVQERLLEQMAKRSKLNAYLDLPFQHISDKILRNMGRPMNSADIYSFIERIRKAVPGVVLRSTFIVGFPGETETQFKELLSFLEDICLDRAGFFTFSSQPGTKAALLPDQIDEETKDDRLFRAEVIQSAILKQKLDLLVGQEFEIIVDQPSADQALVWEGRTRGDAPDIDGLVYFSSDKTMKPGDIKRIKITHSQDYSLIGELVE